jgi:hypothetical protein
MKKNIGTEGRILRFALAVLLLFMAWYWSSWILLIVSLFVFYEALASWCIIYQWLGKNSCPISKDPK